MPLPTHERLPGLKHLSASVLASFLTAVAVVAGGWAFLQREAVPVLSPTGHPVESVGTLGGTLPGYIVVRDYAPAPVSAPSASVETSAGAGEIDDIDVANIKEGSVGLTEEEYLHTFLVMPFEREVRTPVWADAVEMDLRDQLNTFVGAHVDLGFEIESIDCRTTRCMIDLRHPAASADKVQGAIIRREVVDLPCVLHSLGMSADPPYVYQRLLFDCSEERW